MQPSQGRSPGGEEGEGRADATRALAHPQGILPLGQQLIDRRRNLLRETLGPSLAILTDELLARVLEILSARELAILSRVSRALYIFSHADELWKSHVLEAVEGRFTYAFSWRYTYAACVLHEPSAAPARPRGREWVNAEWALFSDVLFHPWMCATAAVPDWWVRAGPSSTTVARVKASELTPAQFAARFDGPGVPVVVEGLADGWPALERWSCSQLRSRLGERSFSVGEMQMRLDDFGAYCQAARDDPPLYLFDPAFAQVAPELLSEYEAAPALFPPDHFALLGAARPDWRWLVVGSRLSGSTWHVDPNRTSAWNTCINGRKKWLLTPPATPPPGVSASADGATIRAPVSVCEWMRGFLRQARHELGSALHEAVVGPGDCLFVPRGWWHTVLNLSPEAVALTHNFVTSANLAEVLLYTHPDGPERDSPGLAEMLVSGVPRAERTQLHARLVRALHANRPDELAAATTPAAVEAARRALRAGRSGGAKPGDGTRARKPSLWTELTGTERAATQIADRCSATQSAVARGGTTASPGQLAEPAFTFNF